MRLIHRQGICRKPQRISGTHGPGPGNWYGNGSCRLVRRTASENHIALELTNISAKSTQMTERVGWPKIHFTDKDRPPRPVLSWVSLSVLRSFCPWNFATAHRIILNPQILVAAAVVCMLNLSGALRQCNVRKSSSTRTSKTWVQMLTLPLPGCLTLNVPF
jgi:hypothetical protein